MIHDEKYETLLEDLMRAPCTFRWDNQIGTIKCNHPLKDRCDECNQERYFYNKSLAEVLTAKGWQKIPEDSIVIKKSQYDFVVAKSERIIIDKYGNFVDYAIYDGDKVLSKAEYRDYIAHEVAQHIFNELMMHVSFDGHTVGIWKNDVLKLAEKYGVDVCDEKR